MLQNEEKSEWPSCKDPKNSSGLHPPYLIFHSRLPPERVTQSSVGNLLSALILECPVHWMFPLLQLPLPWALIKMPAVFYPLSQLYVCRNPESGVKDHLPHRTGQHLFCALHSSHFTQRTSAPPGNRLCHHNSVVTSAYTMKALGISNSLDSFKSWPVRSCPVLALFGGFLKVLFPTFIRMQLIGNGFCINFQTAMFLSWHIRFSQHSFEVRCHYASIKGKDNSIWGSLTSHN